MAYPTQRDKTMRAFGLYLELLDMGVWLKTWMYRHLVSFDLTVPRFRLLMILRTEGPTAFAEAARRLGCKRTNLYTMVEGLEEGGLICQEAVRLPPAEIKLTRLPKRDRGKPRRGPRIAVLRLTKAGEEFLENFLPKHAKWVKSTMRVLDGREQETLKRLSAKLREGDIVKFFEELRMQGEDEW